ncbi:unnamed protein product [Vicia faba]|uniref:Uncharacterized protein n=1 Tax=Vicia faba TaxID=3906 RepID=A0AAV1ASK5_VICFA|nr:unnamed protein product [Vicia faba]
MFVIGSTSNPKPILQYKHNVERDTISLPEASSLVRRSRQCSGDSSHDEKPLDDVKSHVLADVGSLPSSTNILASNQLLALLLKIIKTKQSKKNYPSSSLYNRKSEIFHPNISCNMLVQYQKQFPANNLWLTSNFTKLILTEFLFPNRIPNCPIFRLRCLDVGLGLTMEKSKKMDGGSVLQALRRRRDESFLYIWLGSHLSRRHGRASAMVRSFIFKDMT